MRGFFRPEFERAAEVAPDGSPGFRTCWNSAAAGEWVTLSGELDIAQAPLLERTLRAAEDGATRLIVVDLSELSFIDLTGTRVIVQASERLRRAGGRLIVVRGPRPVEMVFALTGVDAMLEILDPEPAVELLRGLSAEDGDSAAAGP
jgi:anti-anti-sigma factor